MWHLPSQKRKLDRLDRHTGGCIVFVWRNALFLSVSKNINIDFPAKHVKKEKVTHITTVLHTVYTLLKEEV